MQGHGRVKSGSGKGEARRLTKAAAPLGQEDFESLAAFRFALRRFLKASASAVHAVGLTPQQHQALLAMKAHGRSPGMSVRELANTMLLQHHSAGELVERLARDGLVERRADSMDGRRVRLALSARAERLLRELTATHVAELEKIRPELSELLRRFADDR